MSCTGLSCNQGRAPCRDGCQGGHKHQRTCDELGVCQGRNPACHGDCHQPPGAHIDTDQLPPGGFWIAPGVADFEPAPPEPLSWLEVALIAMAASGAVGLVAGLAWGWWRGLL